MWLHGSVLVHIFFILLFSNSSQALHGPRRGKMYHRLTHRRSNNIDLRLTRQVGNTGFASSKALVYGHSHFRIMAVEHTEQYTVQSVSPSEHDPCPFCFPALEGQSHKWTFMLRQTLLCLPVKGRCIHSYVCQFKRFQQLGKISLRTCLNIQKKNMKQLGPSIQPNPCSGPKMLNI